MVTDRANSSNAIMYKVKSELLIYIFTFYVDPF